MAIDPSGDSTESPKSRKVRYRGFFERVNGKLLPFFGPADIDYESDVAGAPTDLNCPVCGHDMVEHVIDHASPNTLLFCPEFEQHDVAPAEGPLNELGMPKRGSNEPPVTPVDPAKGESAGETATATTLGETTIT